MNSNRSSIVRRLIATIVAVFTMCIVIVWMTLGKTEIDIWGYWTNHGFTALAIGPDADPQAGTGPTDGIIEDSIAVYYLVLLGALVLASGGVIALIILRGKLAFKIRLWVYFIFLLIILPASYYNYGHRYGDFALKAHYQVVLNLMLVFLGSTICWGLSEWKVEASDVRVLKIMTFICLIFGSILVPSLLTLMWTLWRFNIVSLETAKTVKIETITALAGVASVIVTLIKYFQEQRKSAT